MMPTKMISEMPLPMPRAVICSPSHIRNSVPPTMVITVTARKNMPGSTTAEPDGPVIASRPDRQAPGLEHGQAHGQVAGVLVDLLAAALALLLQGLQRRRDRRHQLQDDRGGDVGQDAERQDRHALEGTAREHVEHAQDAAALLREDLRHHLRVDARQRDVGAEPVDDQAAEREPQPLLELGGLAEDAEIDVGGELLGYRRHPSLPRRTAGIKLRPGRPAPRPCRPPARPRRSHPWWHPRPRWSPPR